MPSDIVIHRHPVGAVARGLIGVLAIAALFVLSQYLIDQPATLDLFRLFTVLVALVTVERVWTYWLTNLRLTTDDIKFTNYDWIFGSTTSEADWNTVQSLTLSQDAFGKLFNYGTLNVRGADANSTMLMNYVPNVDEVAQVIDNRSDVSGPATGVGDA